MTRIIPRTIFHYAILIICLVTTNANAIPVLYDFEAEVSSNLATGLPSAGSTVSGSFWYDTTGTITRNEFIGSTHVLAFDHSTPAGQPGITLGFGSSSLESNSSISTGLVNNPTDSAIAIIDDMIIQSRSFLHGLSGIPDDVQMQIKFIGGLGILESNGVSIPTSLPLPDDLLVDDNWTSFINLRDRTGTLAPGGVFFSARMTSLVAAVPEPSIIWLLGSGLVLLGFAKRKTA